MKINPECKKCEGAGEYYVQIPALHFNELVECECGEKLREE